MAQKMTKLFNTLILAVTVILLSSSYSVYASDYEYNKCTLQADTGTSIEEVTRHMGIPSCWGTKSIRLSG